MTDAKFMCECLRHMGIGTCNTAADLIEQQAARIVELEARNEPTHRFALIQDRSYDGEGLSLWTWDGEYYVGADGDCLSPDPDGTLDGYTVEWLTDYQLEQRISAMAKDAERLSWLIVNSRRYRLYENKGYWFCVPVTAQDWQEGHKSAREAIDAALAASEPKKEPT